MAVQIPFEAFLQAAQAKEQNRQRMYQNIVGLGQGLGQGLQSIGDILQKKRLKQAMDQFMGSEFAQGDPIAKAWMPIVNAAPMAQKLQLLSPIIAGAYRSQWRKNTPRRTIYQSKETGEVSGMPQTGWEPVELPTQQAAIRLQVSGKDRENRKYRDKIFNLATGKAENMITLDEGKLIDSSQKVIDLLGTMKEKHAALYSKYGGIAKGRGANLVSSLTKGTTEFAGIPVPFSDPDVVALQGFSEGAVGLFKEFVEGSGGGRLSIDDAKRIEKMLDVSMSRSPATVAASFKLMEEAMSAMQENNISRANQALAKLGVKTRLKPNPRNKIDLNKMFILNAMTGGGGGSMSAQSLNPGDLQGLSDEQLDALEAP